MTAASIPSVTARAAAASNLCDALAGQGCDVRLIAVRGTGDMTAYRAQFNRHELYLIPVPAFLATKDAKPLLSSILLFLRQKKWLEGRIAITDNAMIAAALALAGRAFVIDVHTIGPKSRLIKYAIRSPRCLGVTFSGEVIQALFQSAVAPVRKPTMILGGGFSPRYLGSDGDTESLRRKLGIPSGRTVIGYVGSMEPGRGIDLMLAAAKTAGDHLYWLFIGGKPEEVASWSKVVGQLGLNSDSVRFTGFQSQRFLGDWYKTMDIVCAPYSRHEKASAFRTPLKLVEYQAAGKPIIASDLETIHKLVVSRGTVFFNPDEAGAFDAALAKMLAGLHLYRDLARDAQSAMFDQSWDAKAKTFIRWLQNII